MDYIEKYHFSSFKGGGGGIPLHIYGSEFIQDGGNKEDTTSSSSSLYFPGGLFVNSFLDNIDENIVKDEDPTTKNVFENYDVFLDLVSVSTTSAFSKTKKIMFKKKNNNNKKSKKLT
jgi:hypothetical protein